MLSPLLINKVVALAQAAGAAIMKVYQHPQVDVHRKLDSSPLTEADLAAHRLILTGLTELTPNLPVLSEESAIPPWSERCHWQQYWLVDPLDGTKEFLKRNGEFTVNIALIDHGEPVFGVVVAPALGETFWGGRHPEVNGAWWQIDDKVTEVRPSLPESSVLQVVGSRSHASPELQTYLATLHKPYNLVPMGSSLKICRVATEEADLYPRMGPTSEWDTAAAHAFALAAGCTVTVYGGEHDGKPLRYNQKESLLNPSFVVE